MKHALAAISLVVGLLAGFLGGWLIVEPERARLFKENQELQGEVAAKVAKITNLESERDALKQEVQSYKNFLQGYAEVANLRYDNLIKSAKIEGKLAKVWSYIKQGLWDLAREDIEDAYKQLEKAKKVVSDARRKLVELRSPEVYKGIYGLDLKLMEAEDLYYLPSVEKLYKSMKKYVDIASEIHRITVQERRSPTVGEKRAILDAVGEISSLLKDAKELLENAARKYPEFEAIFEAAITTVEEWRKAISEYKLVIEGLPAA